MSKNSPKIVEISSWLTESLRLTVFPTFPTDSDYSNAEFLSWWKELQDNEPDEIIHKPKEELVEQIGSVENGSLKFSIKPNRIDWFLTTDWKNELSLDYSFPNILDYFLKLMMNWLKLENLPKIIRLAFGGVILLPVNSFADGYKLISKFIPVNIEPNGFSDLLYQINRPRESTSDIMNLKINRLSRWTVLKVGTMKIHIPPSSLDQPSIRENVYCHLQLDINTSADFGRILEHSKLQQILSELVELGTEITVRGDIP